MPLSGPREAAGALTGPGGATLLLGGLAGLAVHTQRVHRAIAEAVDGG